MIIFCFTLLFYFILLNITSHTYIIANLNKLCANRSCKPIYECKSKICKFKSNFVSRDKIISTSAKRIFDCLVTSGTTYIDCNSLNVIYLITCSRCSLHYVGKLLRH